MARPKKRIIVDGVELTENLYLDNFKRPSYYRYKKPDGKFKTFRVDSAEEANRMAIEANANRDNFHPRPNSNILQRGHTEFHALEYIAYQVRINPELKTKRSWSNRKYCIIQFCKLFSTLSTLEHEAIKRWWDELSHHQQKARHAEFRRFFNWLMGEGLAPKIKYNPFTTSDDLPRLNVKLKPIKQRKPLTQEAYRKIYNTAESLGYECLQIAMAISRYTTLRESDITGLKWDKNIIDGQLRVIVSKSEAQKGSARATRHCWTLANHPILKKEIDKARALSLEHKRCPYVISHKPKRRVWNEQKEHLYQVTSDRLSRMFKEARDNAGIEGTSFHEIRGLSSTLFKTEGYTNEQIKELMAHESITTTQGYQNADSLPFNEVTLKLDK